LRLLPIIERLKANCPLLNGNVEFAPNLLAPDDVEIANGLPMVWVYADQEAGGKNNSLGGQSQMKHGRFVLMIFAEASSDASEPLEDLREQIDLVLGGSKNGVKNGPARFVIGELKNLSKRHVEWHDTWEDGKLLTNNI
jgi:hypothetical protein